jgi:LAO/AO transport system kinase
MNDDVDARIAALFEAGSVRGLARAISRAEAGRGAALMHRFYRRTGRAVTIGLTGPPGVGKSTLSSAIVSVARARGKTVGVVSVDPSSPFSHGAILGDRIRLGDHFTDPHVFIRSMASRGHLGGLAGATGDAVAFMDAFGFDVVLVETVGVGQSEIEIAELADTTLVVMQPGSGDSVQLLKAGILEVADIFVVNKADHPMALQLQREVRGMMEMLHFPGWTPELIATRAREHIGIEELWLAIERHDAHLRASGELATKRRAAFAHRVRALALGELERRLDAQLAALLAPDAGGVERGDPYDAAETLVERFAAALPPEPEAAVAPAPVRATVKGL